MSVTIKNFLVASSDGIHTLNGKIYLPEGNIRGFFHIVHGMTEHIGRYNKIMTDMANEGFICFGYDNLGHGHTAKDKSELGFIAKKNGYDHLCRDVKVFSDAVRAEYDPEGKLPYYLMGHSMGSFIVRLAAEKYVKADKLIIMGTGGPNPAVGAGILLATLIKTFCGERHFSPLIESLSVGGYRKKKFDDPNPELPNAWLSTYPETRLAHKKDEYCNFKFSVSAMRDLFKLLKYSNRAKWYKNLNRDMPILLVSGEEDPVGDFGNGVRTVYGNLKKAELNAECKLYPKARHEILNDFTYDEVKADILEFLSK